jgi:serine/threonine protein kinase
MSMIGKTLAHYEITSQIGKGGMGEVYQAKDTKLGRDVAIKVLPEEFARDADRVARFQREAKLLASLNHPNIAAIYGLEAVDGIHFLVMELIEGDTLADRIKAGAIPVEESLKLALQIAEALEAAHEKGVIHRDLKPANIKVTPDGKVKVLDFGLAKAFAGDSENINLSNSPTLSDAATQQGVILGTAAYMSPEQARGKPVDKRTDIWAFGCVLYEMLTGKAAFQGEDVTEILAAVVKSGVNLDLLPANIHFRVREVITRCLQKEQKKRYGSISDAHYEIEQVLSDSSGVFAQPVTAEAHQKKLRTMLPWVAAAIVVAGVVGWFLKPAPPPEPRPVTRFEYTLPKDQGLDIIQRVTISKDGTKIAYSANGQLYLKNTKELTSKLIPIADDNPGNPFFSPDGQWIGYWSLSDGQLKKIEITSGAPQKICDGGFIHGASWGEDGMIVFAYGNTGIMQVSANGGIPKVIVKAGEMEPLSFPQMLPNGKSILFTALTENGPQVTVQSLESEKRKNLFAGDFVQYLPTEHLVYALDNNLFAIAFDPDRLETIGGSIPMDEGVYQMPWVSLTQAAISDTGTLVYVPGNTPESPLSKSNLIGVDRQGKVEKISAPPDLYSQYKISPDGTKVALTKITEEGSSDIYILDLDSETNPQPLTFNGNSNNPLWTPDSQRIVFLSGEGDERSIYCKNANGTGKIDLLFSMSEGYFFLPLSWADDGKTMVATKRGRSMRMWPSGMRGRGPAPKRASDSEGSSTNEETGGGMGIGTLSMEGEHEWTPLLNLKGWVDDLQISPDGKWIAYISNESGAFEIYVRPFPEMESGGPWQVTTDGASSNGFKWSQDGLEFFYFSGGLLKVVELETEPTFKPDISKVIFNISDIGLSISDIFQANLNINPNDDRFLMLKEVETAADESQTEAPQIEFPRKIIFVTNWFEELKEKVPVD